MFSFKIELDSEDAKLGLDSLSLGDITINNGYFTLSSSGNT